MLLAEICRRSVLLHVFDDDSACLLLLLLALLGAIGGSRNKSFIAVDDEQEDTLVVVVGLIISVSFENEVISLRLRFDKKSQIRF